MVIYMTPWGCFGRATEVNGQEFFRDFGMNMQHMLSVYFAVTAGFTTVD